MYDDVVVLVEADGVDSGGVPGVFADILGLDDIGEDDVFVAASTDEVGIDFADVQRVHVIVVHVLVLLYHHVFGGIVEAHRSVLRPCHHVLAVVVEF